MGNLASGIWENAAVGTVVLVVQNHVAPTDAEWSAYVENVRRCVHLEKVSGIAFTDGGTPNPRQRVQINEVLRGRQGPSAVVSDNMIVRGVVTALSWFNKQTVGFSPKAIMEAMRFAGVTGVYSKSLWDAIKALDARIDPHATTVELAAAHLRF